MRDEPYATLLARNQAIRDALNAPWVASDVAALVACAQVALERAGVADRKVRVQIHVSDADGCGLVIITPGRDDA